MYRAIHNYKTNEDGIFNVSVGDIFWFVERHDLHWWRMRGVKGDVGLVPASHLVCDEDEKPALHPSHSSILESVDRAIETIHQQAAYNAGKYTADQRTNLQKLLAHRKQMLGSHGSTSSMDHLPISKLSSKSSKIIPSQPKRKAPACPGQDGVAAVGKTLSAISSSEGQAASAKITAPAAVKRPAPAPPVRATQHVKETQDKSEKPSHSTPEVHTVPLGMAAELVEMVRIETSLSYDKSFVAIETVLGHIEEHIPSLSPVMRQILNSVVQQRQNASSSVEELLQTNDGQVLQKIFGELTKHKNDSQQRSWALHDDEQVIGTLLDNLQSLLVKANPEVCRAVLRIDDYVNIHTLVTYYQMEQRVLLRRKLLDVLSSFCGFGREFVMQLLCSVLPLELARDMQQDKTDLEKLCQSAKLMSMIFSTGEMPPVNVDDELDEHFADFLIDLVENVSEDVIGEDGIDAFVGTILSFNQHFVAHSSNPVMIALAHRGTAKVLSEGIVMLVNRGRDPVVMFDYHDPCPDSVVKFLLDIFSSRTTSDFFYTTDMMVLLEIILRQISDLSPGDQVRTEYLSLLHLVLQNTDYSGHQQDQLSCCLARIGNEPDDTEQDKVIVQEIYKAFPDFLS